MSNTTQHENGKSMAVVTPANAGRKQGRFQPGTSGNPRGKPRGACNRATAILKAISDDDAAEITRAVIAKAKQGDATCAKIIFDRLWPIVRTGPALDLPKLDCSGRAVAAANVAVLAAVSDGKIEAEAGESILRLIAATVETMRAALPLSPEARHHLERQAKLLAPY